MSNPLNFLNDKKWLTIAVIGSFFIWKLMSSVYDNIFDPFMKKSIPINKFKFLNNHVDGLVKYNEDKKIKTPISFNVGNLIRDLIICSIIILLLFIITKNIKN